MTHDSLREKPLFDLPVTRNPLVTRSDVQEAVQQLCEPLNSHYSLGKARLRLGVPSAIYSDSRCEMEAFARVFWGLMPLVSGGGETKLADICREGLLHGTDPGHPEYWGDLQEVDQMAVEMPPIALSLALAPGAFWAPFSESERKQIVGWLNQINTRSVADNNWRAFPVLVNASFKHLGLPYDAEVMEAGLQRLDDFYLGDGWYSDGSDPQRDYYIAFAIHYYSLIYARMMEDDDPDRSRKFKDRAVAFAHDFIHWFSAKGEALPYGRSLTYRFAQGAFWGALAFSGVEAFPWGVIKGLYLRHLRYWFRQPIFNSGGLLTIGYAYPNLFMSEMYNGPGSPYWSFKAFIPLAVPEEHPFWAADELPYPDVETRSLQKHASMSIRSSASHDHKVAFASGQWNPMDYGHASEKYSKFAYSTHFGFSVSREAVGLIRGAYDSMLALSDGNDHWRVRRQCEDFSINGDTIVSVWKPWEDVSIETHLIPGYPWHLRKHVIQTGRPLETAEGGFAVARKDELDPLANMSKVDDGALYRGSGILNLQGDRVPCLVDPFPHTNIMKPRTVIPTLTGHLEPGTHQLVCAVLGEPDDEKAALVWLNPPVLSEF